MKRILLLFVALSLCAATMAQLRPTFTKTKSQDIKVLRPTVKLDGNEIGIQNPNSTVASKSALDDPSLMVTRYDLQTNGSTENRIYMYSDGTIGATANFAHADPTASADRGTGYNYYNGTTWGPVPTARTESVRTGWPAYAPCGPTGEITISHQSATAPMVIMKRATKGTGTWTQTTLAAPAGATAGMLWPRLVTSHTDHNTVHVIAMTAPTGNGGTAYQGLNGALLYTRSTDGGTTWEAWRQLDGMTSTNYTSFSGDAYAFAQPHGDTIAFVYGDNWMDLAYLKSTDNGVNWTRHLIWENPWTLWPGTAATDTFYASDGCVAAALDKYGKLHVSTGLMRANGDATGAKFYFPVTDGLAYWNENMPAWPSVITPTILDGLGSYVGWVTDTNVFYQAGTAFAYYGNSLSSFPALVTDNSDQLFLVWSGVTTIMDQNGYMYRHTFARASITNGASWRDTIVPLNTNFLYNFLEAVYPSASPTSNDNLQILIQTDAEAGVYLNGSQGLQGQADITNNDITYLNPTKASIINIGVGINEKQDPTIQAMVFPNPVQGNAKFNIVTKQGGNLTIEVSNLLGQNVLTLNKGMVNAGSMQVSFNASQLHSGVYVYKIKVNNQAFTGKMIVE